MPRNVKIRRQKRAPKGPPKPPALSQLSIARARRREILARTARGRQQISDRIAGIVAPHRNR